MWARIGIFLVAALILAAAGGVWFGHMLTQQAPVRHAAPLEEQPTQLLGMDGQPVTPEPPQPLVDGTLGVPSRPGASSAKSDIPMVSILEDENLAIQASSASGSQGADDLEALLQREGNFTIAGIDLTSPGGSSPNADQGHQAAPARPELPPDLAFAVALPADAPAAPSAPAWREALRTSLARCARQSYFSPRECEQRLRLQHCEPNGGWGQVPECPAHLRNTRF